jgi:hypothetical protein
MVCSKETIFETNNECNAPLRCVRYSKSQTPLLLTRSIMTKQRLELPAILLLLKEKRWKLFLNKSISRCILTRIHADRAIYSKLQEDLALQTAHDIVMIIHILSQVYMQQFHSSHLNVMRMTWNITLVVQGHILSHDSTDLRIHIPL